MAPPTTQTLRTLLSLSEKRDALQAQLDQINAQLEAALAGKSVEKVALLAKATKAPKAAKPAKAETRGKRGALKGLIVEALNAAGGAGVAVKDLAAQLGKKTQNIHVWFTTTGKTVGATKVRPGVYALSTALEPATSGKQKVRSAKTKKS